MITLHSVSVDLGRGELRKRVLDDINWIVPSRSQIVILGHQGSGKTTFLQTLSGMLLPSQGWVQKEGAVTPATGYMNFGSRQSSPRQLLTRLSRLYGVRNDQLLDFVVDFAGIEHWVDKPMQFFPKELRLQLHFALLYGIPSDCYVFDRNFVSGNREFKERCLQANLACRKRSAVVLATANSHVALNFGGDGVVLHRGKLELFPTLQEAVSYFETLPKVPVEVRGASQAEPLDPVEEDELLA